MNKRILALLLALIVAVGVFAGCDLLDGGIQNNDGYENNDVKDTNEAEKDEGVYGYASVDGIPDYSGKAYVELNGNQPEFTEEEKVTASYEFYSELDSLGRCGYTVACVGKDIMPTEDRESISSVKPSGWVNNKYDTELVDGGYIYNRCHLIGFQLTGENANKNNLITGTRYLNIEGMLPFENMVADYVKETGNHVMYRVTPVFVGNNLLASGVKIEGWSVEDNGEGICFNVFAYNVQPGITINYATGDNVLNGETLPEEETNSADAPSENGSYILNTSSKKIHRADCTYAVNIKEENKREYTGSIDDLLADGYTACGTCKPE
ncbi:MAG: DNA/RNA non-specific endonuclease [Clostridia bacterium]|nr:DNA/RNA non-specific endonuclease [Clostridia bacterium]